MLKTNIKKITLLSCTLPLALLVFAGVFSHQKASAAFDVNFTNIWVGKITPGQGNVGVDIWWPSSGTDYNPCQHSSDIYYGACVLANAAPTSYYKVMHYTPSGTDFPYGIFIDNQNQNTCKTSSWCNNKSATSFNTNWGRLITDASIEIYPQDTNGQYNPSTGTVGGVRIQSNFPGFANGGRYSNNIGDIALPQVGEANVGRLNGFITNNGSAVANNRVTFEIFQENSSRGSSTGYPETGFSVVHNNSDGYFNTGALPSGSYKIYITDTQTGHKIVVQGVGIRQLYERLDFKLDQRCFGYSSCIDPAS